MRIRCRIRGTVQGVGYRYFVMSKAESLHLTGWVRNCSNGDVECEAQGAPETLDRFRNELETGHPWARVSDITQEILPDRPDGKNFEISY